MGEVPTDPAPVGRILSRLLEGLRHRQLAGHRLDARRR